MTCVYHIATLHSLTWLAVPCHTVDVEPQPSEGKGAQKYCTDLRSYLSVCLPPSLSLPVIPSYLSQCFIFCQVYEVELDKEPTASQVAQLANGVFITTTLQRDKKAKTITAMTLPCKVKKSGSGSGTSKDRLRMYVEVCTTTPLWSCLLFSLTENLSSRWLKEETGR